MKDSKSKNEVATPPNKEDQKGAKNHQRIAKHLQAAAKSHLKAAKHHEKGNHKKAAKSTVAAYGHISLAKKAQRQDVRHHVLNG